MAHARFFVGVGSGALGRAATALRTLCEAGTGYDGRGVLVITPTGRGGRALLRELVSRCDGIMIPPRIVTPAGALDAILGGTGRRATLGVELAAWREGAARACAGRSKENESGLAHRDLADRDLAHRDLADRDFAHLASHARRLYSDLASAGLSVDDALRKISEASGTIRGALQTAAGIAREYEGVLREWGFVDPWQDRGDALANGRFATHRAVALVGVLELPGLVRRALEQSGAEVHAIVLHDAGHSVRFDEIGCVKVAPWNDARLELDDRSIAFVGDRDAMVRESLVALDVMTREGGSAVVCCPAPSGAREFQGVAARYTDVAFRVGYGRSAGDGALAEHLERACEWFERRTLVAARAYLGDAIGHAAASAWLWWRGGGAATPDVMLALDSYMSQTLSTDFTGAWLRADGVDHGLLDLAIGACGELLDTFIDPALRRPGARASVASWAAALANCAAGALRGAAPGAGTLDEEWDVLVGVLRELSGVPSSEPVSAPEAVGLVREAMRGVSLTEGAGGQIDVIGWLELALEPAECVVIAGLVDPGERGDDPFTDRERETLGLPSRASRLARDAALLTSVTGGGRPCRIVVPRVDASGDVCRPSPLLLRDHPERVAHRLGLAIGEHRAGATPRLSRVHATGKASAFIPFVRVGRSEPASIAVTSFRSYLESPYLYYLQHVERLREPVQRLDELDPPSFGTLMHEILQRFGEGSVRDSVDAREISAALAGLLGRVAAERYGASPPVTLSLQLEAASARLEAFARRQAVHAREGWRILHTEWSPAGGGRVLDVDGRPIRLTGKIDRIDRHRDGRVALLDYKTSESAVDPTKVHCGPDGRWKDLQLPLYAYLADPIIGEAPIVTGYINLPGDRYAARFTYADFGTAHFADALEEARGIVRLVREGQFDDGWRVPRAGVLASLCGVGFVGLDDEDEEEESE